MIRSRPGLCRFLTAGVALAVVLLPGTAYAQRGGQRGGPGGLGARGAEANGAMAVSFESNSPAPGEAMPDVVVHRSSGEPVAFRQLLGEQYTVVIFGCLT